MKMFDKAAIIGTGLIGGSIALGLKKKNLCRQVTGLGRHRNNLLLARRRGVIDLAASSLREIKDADLVILALPVSEIIRQAPAISAAVRKDCVVFDVGSTKTGIVKKLTGLFPLFVGTHPLAGSEKKGVINANADLFRGCLCVITPQKNTNRRAMAKVVKLWKALGAKVRKMPPELHDRALGFVSHLPHLAAFSLINAIPGQFLGLSPASLKDSTRIASSDSRLWADIIMDNRKNCLETLSSLRAELRTLDSALRSGKKSRLAGLLERAKKRRDSLK